MFDKARIGYKLSTGRISFTISDSLYKEYEEYCKENGYITPKLIECILDEYLEKYHPNYINYETKYIIEKEDK